jgi:hypothetical protein
MTIQFLRIQIAILQDKRLSNTQKMLLGLIVGFGARGCSMGNDSIGEVLGVNPKYIGELLAGLLGYDLIEIHNGQSRYRKIYFRKKQEVEPESTSGNNGPTHRKNQSYSPKKPEHIRSIGKNKGARPSADADTHGETQAADTTDYDLYDACARSLTRDADPVEVDEILKGMPQ